MACAPMSLAVLGDTRARGHDITYARSATCVQARNACMRGVHAHFASITLTLLLRSLIWVPAGSGGKAGPCATDQTGVPGCADQFALCGPAIPGLDQNGAYEQLKTVTMLCSCDCAMRPKWSFSSCQGVLLSSRTLIKVLLQDRPSNAGSSDRPVCRRRRPKCSWRKSTASQLKIATVPTHISAVKGEAV